MKDTKTQCKAAKPDGSSCQAANLPGSEYCFFHDPAKATERRAAQSLGGSQNKMKTLPAAVPDVCVTDCEDVVKLLSETINQVRKGQIDPRVANAIGYLANVLIKASEQGELEKRISEVESLLKNRNHGLNLG
ncbi:MAG TPA: hypothetical protein VL486_00925 [Verrucomicrobiae bacterium]|nr:hypothetical protein [Verrucomicrobiae bacterium]